MKIFNNIYKYSIAVLLAMTSCAEHEIDSGGEHGYVDLKVAMDANLSVVPVARSSAGAVMPVALTIYDAKGTICREIEDFTNMDSPLSLLTGKYSVRAVVGTESSVPFTYEPCYTGRADFEVKANVVSSADIVCTLATTKVTVTLSEQIKDNFSYSLELTNGTGTEIIDRTTPDDREIYFMVTGSLSWVLTLENADGEQFTLGDSYSSVAAAQHYDLHFSLDTTDMGKLGAGEFSIIVDDSLSDPKIHDITIVIDKSAPVIDGQSSVSKSLSDQYTEGVYTVTSVLPLASVAVSHSDAALLQAGLPQNVDLFTDRYALMMLQDAGVEVLIYSGAVIQPSVDDETTEIRLDFSGLINALSIGQYAFTISSSNTTGKVEAMDVNVNVLSSLASPSLEPWAEFIYVKGSWTSDVRPDGLKVQYRLSGAEQWTDFVPSEATGEIFYDDMAKTYRAFVCGLASSSAYELRVLSDRECLDSRSVTTDKSEQLYNMSFDEWSDDGKNPYANGKEGIWDTANPGTAISIINITPTTPESNDKIYGKAVRMESMYKMKFAAGNIYTGQFNKVNVGKMGAELDWGVPFNARPVGMSGWYKYTPVTINHTGEGYGNLNGQMDKCQILFGLFTNWTSRFPIKTYEGKFVDFSAANQDIVATNDILDGSTDGKWKNFTLYAGYRKNTFRSSPTYIITAACASYKGDYFTGGEGSVLLVDEFEYIYDPMKLKPEDRAAFFGLFD